jgi:hypothetical protein
LKEQTGIITMSQKELLRLEIIQQLSQRQFTQIKAAKKLNLSVRQVRRLHTQYLKSGAKALVSKKRNQPSNNQLKLSKIELALTLLRNEYKGFGPSFAQEKLLERNALKFSVETLRKLMIKHGLWKSRQRKQIKHHQMRARRSSFGELVQIDGSPHDWFEGRSAGCCLLVFIDDATSRILHLSFVPHESTQAYFDATEAYIALYGLPMAFYSDKHSVFRINTPEATNSTGETQFGRALRELDIELICANSPQAKGRVERANKTLQDRLIKEMRLAGINTIEQANPFLPSFVEKHNVKFAIEPICSVDAHRKAIPAAEAIKSIFSHKATRKLSKNLELSYNNIIYQIQTKSACYTMRGATIDINERKGEVALVYKGNRLSYKTFDKNNRPATTIIDTKQLNKHLDAKIKFKPKSDHPWKKNGIKTTHSIAA